MKTENTVMYVLRLALTLFLIAQTSNCPSTTFFPLGKNEKVLMTHLRPPNLLNTTCIMYVTTWFMKISLLLLRSSHKLTTIDSCSLPASTSAAPSPLLSLSSGHPLRSSLTSIYSKKLSQAIPTILVCLAFL